MIFISDKITREALANGVVDCKDVKACNNFLAAGAGKMKGYKNVDESGIGGTVCNHRCPMDFVNMTEGEKYM